MYTRRYRALQLHRASQELALVERELRKVGEVTMVTEKQDISSNESGREQPLPVRWIAENDEGVVGEVVRTSRGEYRASDVHGRKVGIYRTLTAAREGLAKTHDSTVIQRMDQSRVLLVGGLFALVATVAVAVVGIILLFNV